ncbi:MAG: acetolactate decarboxylase [Cyanobium sp.]
MAPWSPHCRWRWLKVFERIKIRVACRVPAGTDLMTATSPRPNSALTRWRALHSDDHTHGGHVLDLQTSEFTFELHTEDHLQLAMPEKAGFLPADLSGDPSISLAKAKGDDTA